MAANNMKLRVTGLLILYGMIVVLGQTKGLGVKACPRICQDDIAYMTCPSSGDEHLQAGCSCCFTPNSKGCTLHSSDGSSLKVCP